MDLVSANKVLLDVTDSYQHIKWGRLSVPVPYFINTAEQIYKKVMRDVGIENELVLKAVQLIKEAKTPLGCGGGKGSPEEVTQDLHRTMNYLESLGYFPKKITHIRSWMVNMHVGLDCAGYVFNILKAIENSQKVNIINKLAWTNPHEIRRSHAGAFVFNTEEFEEVTDYSAIRPVDIVIDKDLTHVGIMAMSQNSLFIADCSLDKNGITFGKIVSDNGIMKVECSDYWTNLLNSRSLIIRRPNLSEVH